MHTEITWHAREADDIFARLDSGPEGLTQMEAGRRLDEHGGNELQQEKGESRLQRILDQFKSPLIYILIIAALISLLIGHLIDAAVILGVIVVNAIIGIIQEWRAEHALEALKRLTVPHALVVRDGGETEIEASEIVPGDIIRVAEGDTVPADARLIDSEDLQVVESSLTGEASAAEKQTDVIAEDAPLAERSNMIWMSDAVVSGHATAVVVATGMATEIGKITRDVQQTRRQQTPIQKRIDRLGTYLGYAGLLLGILVFILGVIRGKEMGEMLFFAVAMSVSAIPEGLPAVISITLALGVQRMAEENAVVRRMSAVETLGSTTVICSDKTGTITQNRMVVKNIWTGSRFYDVSGQGYDPEGGIESTDEGEVDEKTVSALLRCGALANNAGLDRGDDGWSISGDPTEAALLVAARKDGVNEADIRETTERLDEIPFSSDRKYMGVLVKEDGAVRLYVKGSTEVVLSMCRQYLSGSGEQDITDGMRQAIEKAEDELARRGLRVLAGAYADMPPDTTEVQPEDIGTSLVFCGMWGMEDPPREEAIESIRQAQQAGIRIVMITGDQPVTAASIAERVGIIGENRDILTGADIDRLSDEELAEKVRTVSVFARVSPHHKVAIKDALMRNGETVAMSGDGVNDAPTLKGADIGVAMGRTGTEVAREAADLILMDDNFATIVTAVEEGRVIFDNLKRVIFFLITTSIGEVLTLTGALVFGMQLPLTPIMILWINLITDAPADVPLGIEPKHRDVLNRPPLKKQENIFNAPYIRRMFLLAPLTAIGTLGMFLWASGKGDIAYARTAAFTTLASFQWFLAFTSRSQHSSVFSIGLFRNRLLLAGIALAVLLQLGVIYTGIGQSVFQTAPLDAGDWLIILPAASSILVVDEILKLFRVHS